MKFCHDSTTFEPVTCMWDKGASPLGIRKYKNHSGKQIFNSLFQFWKKQLGGDKNVLIDVFNVKTEKSGLSSSWMVFI